MRRPGSRTEGCCLATLPPARSLQFERFSRIADRVTECARVAGTDPMQAYRVGVARIHLHDEAVAFGDAGCADHILWQRGPGSSLSTELLDAHSY